MNRLSPLTRVLGGLLTVSLLILLGSQTPTHGEGGAEPRPAPADPRAETGARLFDECVKWVGQGTGGIQRAKDFYVKLEAELDLDQARHKGPMRVWWATNDHFRWEVTTAGRTTTKILNVRRDRNPPMPQMWILEADGRVRRMHGTQEGATAIPQLQEDASRLGDLAQFITLRELKGPNVRFLFDGLKKGNGTYAGEWAKVTRVAPGATNISFWLAYRKDAEGVPHASWPGIVRVAGDAREKIPTEDYILRDWRKSPKGQPRGFNYPRSIEAYSFVPGTGQSPARFLKATVQDIKINAGIDESRFSPPPRRQPRGGGQPGPRR
jgi:hypothetical protein